MSLVGDRCVVLHGVHDLEDCVRHLIFNVYEAYCLLSDVWTVCCYGGNCVAFVKSLAEGEVVFGNRSGVRTRLR